MQGTANFGSQHEPRRGVVGARRAEVFRRRRLAEAIAQRQAAAQLERRAERCRRGRHLGRAHYWRRGKSTFNVAVNLNNHEQRTAIVMEL